MSGDTYTLCRGLLTRALQNQEAIKKMYDMLGKFKTNRSSRVMSIDPWQRYLRLDASALARSTRQLVSSLSKRVITFRGYASTVSISRSFGVSHSLRASGNTNQVVRLEHWSLWVDFVKGRETRIMAWS